MPLPASNGRPVRSCHRNRSISALWGILPPMIRFFESLRMVSPKLRTTPCTGFGAALKGPHIPAQGHRPGKLLELVVDSPVRARHGEGIEYLRSGKSVPPLQGSNNFRHPTPGPPPGLVCLTPPGFWAAGQGLKQWVSPKSVGTRNFRYLRMVSGELPELPGNSPKLRETPRGAWIEPALALVRHRISPYTSTLQGRIAGGQTVVDPEIIRIRSADHPMHVRERKIGKSEYLFVKQCSGAKFSATNRLRFTIEKETI